MGTFQKFKIFQSSTFYFFILLLISFILYWEPAYRAPILNFDDRQLLIPMANVRSIYDYISLWQGNMIMDLQPVRDLSYFLEYRLAAVQGIGIHPQAFNVLLWISACFFAVKIFRMQGFADLESKLAGLFLSVHPVAVNSIAWSSGRKHVLSLFFISIASWLWLRWLHSEKRGVPFSAVLFYILSCLSQPINAGWVLWAGLTVYLFHDSVSQRNEKIRNSAVPIILCLISGIITVSLNVWYYSSSRYSVGLGTKFVDEGFAAVPNRFFIFGRFLFQLLIPFRPSITSYDPSSWLSVIGIIILPLFIFAVWKLNENRKQIIVWSFFTLLPLITVNGPSNQHFGWDTYLLTPLLGWTMILGLTLRNISEKYNASDRNLLIIILSFILIFSVIAKTASEAWKDDESLWKRAVETEGSAAAMAGYIKTSLSLKKNVHKLWPNALELQKKQPNDQDIPYIFGRMIFEDPELNRNEKEELFAKYEMKSPWFVYYRSAFDASDRRFTDADRRMSELFQNDPGKTALYFRDRLPEISASWYAMCVFAKKSTCQENIRQIRRSLPPGRWNEEEFSKRLSSFRLAPFKSE
ncbi:MAG TPA: hypothetical protein PL169_19355 [Leptospiraceae bacterium]|nr:hypothetical protein [Leptospiraceae bacterium]